MLGGGGEAATVYLIWLVVARLLLLRWCTRPAHSRLQKVPGGNSEVLSPTPWSLHFVHRDVLSALPPARRLELIIISRCQNRIVMSLTRLVGEAFCFRWVLCFSFLILRLRLPFSFHSFLPFSILVSFWFRFFRFFFVSFVFFRG